MTTEDTSTQGSYREKLFDKRWLEKRAEIIKRDNFRCIICGSTNGLVVHHKQYHYNKKENRKSDPWEYKNKHLVTLCESCHKRGHYKYDIPMKEI